MQNDNNYINSGQLGDTGHQPQADPSAAGMQQSNFVHQSSAYPQSPVFSAEDQEHSYLLAVFFSYMGFIGLDRFYLGYKVAGVLKFLTFGGLGIWWLIDLILVSVGALKARGSQLPLDGYRKFSSAIKMALIIIAVWYGLLLAVTFGLSLLAALAVGSSSQSGGSNGIEQPYEGGSSDYYDSYDNMLPQ